MRRNILYGFWVIFAVMFLCLTVSSGTAEEDEDEDEEFLLNPGFETVTDPDAFPPGWDPPNPGPATATLIADARTSYRGSYYMKLEYGIGDTGHHRIAADCRIEVGARRRARVYPEKEYSLSVWAKGKGKIHFGVTTLNEKFKSVPPTIGSEEMKVETDEWKRYEYIYEPRENDAYAMIGLWFEGTIYVDEFSFREADVSE